MFTSSKGARSALPLALCALAVSMQGPARAQDQEVVANPPLLELKRKLAPRLKSGAQAQPSREASINLNVVYTTGKLWDPAARRFDEVKLRSYQGDRVDPAAPFVSPMLDIKPGDTLRIALNNKLPADPTCLTHDDVNVPHCFNGTNLHTHGLWVNPAGNGDNVLIAINPGVSFEYEYNIPSDHPAGTFWYHTHLHGSTALQVSSGMAGALVIRGNRLPAKAANGRVTGGDIDTLLQPLPAQSFKERVVVMQQIQYACRDTAGNIKTNPDKTYRCDPGDTGMIEGAKGGRTGYDLFSPKAWSASGRYTSLNGRVLPVFKDARAGHIERWRVIHGGVRDTINLEFRRLKAGAPSLSGLSAADNDAFIGANCTGEALPQHLVAADGLTLGAVMKTTQTVFQPAYRWDALMVFPEAGRYCVIDAAAQPGANVDGAPPSRQLLGMVQVQPGRPVPRDTTRYVESQLIASAQARMPADVRDSVVKDLRNGLKLGAFVPHPTIEDIEVTGQQTLTFSIGGTPTQFMVDGKPFKPGRVDRELQLHGVDEWTMNSDVGSHPFHIHVNPFQVVKVLDPKGRDVSGPDAVDDAEGKVDPQYRGLKGVWKDSLWVKNFGGADAAAGRYTVVVRTRYQRYIGDFVLHCHILDHEDQGMMQMVRMVLPDGVGGKAKPHH